MANSRTTGRINIWHDKGSQWASIGVQFDPTLDAVMGNIDREEAYAAGVDLDGFDDFGCYHPEFAAETQDVNYLLGAMPADLAALRFQAMGG